MMNKQQQRQVWQRVYGHTPQAKPIAKETLRQAQQRLQQNLQLYDRHSQHPIYGPAFQRLSQQTQEHIQMLQQIQGG